MITYNKKRVLKRQLKNKIIILFVCVYILLSILFYVSIRVYTKISYEKVIKSTKSNLSQASSYIALLIDQARAIAQYISQKTEVAKFANINNPSPFQKYIALESIRQDIIQLSELNTNVESIFVYFENANIISTSTYGNYLIEILEDTAVYKAIKYPSSYIGNLRYIKDDFISKKGIITFIVKGNSYNIEIHSNVILMINFNEETIYNIIKDVKSTNPSMPILLSPNGEILSCDNKELLGSQFFIEDEKISKSPEGYSKMTIWNRNVYVFVNNQHANIFKLVYLFPEDNMVSEKEIIMIFMAVEILLFLIASLLINTMYMKGIYQPLMKLVNFMEKAEDENLTKAMDDRREDEFGYLYKSFNTMIQRINTLILTTHQQDELRRKMEVKELEKQINPHFLYNTLDMVNWLAKKNNVREISRIVLGLSTIYKNAFNKGNPLISCKAAIESCKSYLEIQRIRYHGKLSYKIETDPKLDDCLILNLLLQTIVENAVVHGFENMDKEGIVMIKNEYLKDENAILFTISDNGVGMTQKKLELQKKLLQSENVISNSGLTNVQRRIKLYYGSQYGITIESEPHKGTTVYMKIPYVVKTENMKSGFN